MIAIFVITLLLFSISVLSTQNLSNVSGEYWRDRANFAALAGVQRSLTELNESREWEEGFDQVPLVGESDVRYTVRVSNPGTDHTGQFGPDGITWIPPGAVWVQSIGSLANRSAGISAFVSVLGSQRPIFDHAIFVLDRMVLDNSHIVSWHPETLVDGEAWLGTNSIEPSSVIIRNNSYVDGDIETGVDPSNGTAVLDLDSSSTLIGEHRVSEQPKNITEYQGPVAPVSSDQVTPLTPSSGRPDWLDAANFFEDGLGNRTVTLTPSGTGSPYGTIFMNNSADRLILSQGGVYHFQGSLDLRNGASLEILPGGVSPENPAVVYVDDSFNVIGNGRVNWDSVTDEPGNPRSLQITELVR